MGKRFDGRIADVPRTHRFHGAKDLDATLLRFVVPCNHQLPRSALHSKTPPQAMQASHPHWFNERSCDRPGCGTYPDVGVTSTVLQARDDGTTVAVGRAEMRNGEWPLKFLSAVHSQAPLQGSASVPDGPCRQ